MEVMSKLKEGEQIWYQLLIQPAGEASKEEGEAFINKKHGITDDKHKGGLFPKLDLGFNFADAIRAPFNIRQTSPP